MNIGAKLLLVATSVIWFGCVEENASVTSCHEKKSFVISCGSGCALVYDLKGFETTEDCVVLNFEVNMFIDEIAEQSYFETYKVLKSEGNRIATESGVILSEQDHGALFVEMERVVGGILE